MSSGVRELARRGFDAQALVAAFPPRLTHRNKQIVYGIACPPGSVHAGQIVFSRWAGAGLLTILEPDALTTFEARGGYFDYSPVPAVGPAVEWHLNFAHADLFCAYGGPLFAQDEMQVTEHPALGSLRQALIRSDIEPLTVEGGVPTPVLVRGVERRCRVATDPDASRGRPNGLYGNAFARASAAAVARATEALVPPTVSNLLAMEAPTGGGDRYTRADIEYVLATATTGFTAARLESRDVMPQAVVVVHTGFWGCGAYGGNRVLMAVLQLLAARLSGLDRLVFHTGDAAGSQAYLRAKDTLEHVVASGPRPRVVSGIVTQLEEMEFPWGVSDGN